MANWSGLWNGLASGTVASEDYALNSGRSPNRYHLTRLLRKRGMHVYRDMIAKLMDDSTPGTATATVTYSRVTAAADTASNAQGGSRAIESKEMVGGIGILNNTNVDFAGANTARVTHVDDETEVQEDWALLGDRRFREPTDGSGAKSYPADASGKKNIHGDAI